MVLVGTGECFEVQVVQKAQWPIWESIGPIILGSTSIKVLVSANLINLSSRNLGKTHICSYLLPQTSAPLVPSAWRHWI